jgi:hypothetical protein
MGGFVHRLVAASLLILALAACSKNIQPTPAPAAIPTWTSTAAPMPTPLPPTTTPTAKSASEWKGVPIMPGAIAGEGDEDGFVFIIPSTSQQIQEFYQLELGKLGWELVLHEESETSITLIFTNSASAALTVTILAKGEEALVLLAN